MGRSNDRLFKRAGGRVFYGWYYGRNGRVTFSTKTSDRQTARAILREAERRAHGAGRASADTAGRRVSDLLGQYVKEAELSVAKATMHMILVKAGHLMRLLGEGRLGTLQRSDIEGFVRQRLKEGAARETIRKELSVLRMALRRAHEQGELLRTPGELIPAFRVRYEPRLRHLTPEEFRMLLECLPPERAWWVCIAVFTGARDSEVDGLRWDNIDLKNRTVHLPGTKTLRSRRSVPLHPDLRQSCEERWTAGERVVAPWLNRRRDLVVACTKLGIGRINPTDLRRTFASWLKQQGVDSAVVARLLGHSSTRMVDLVYGQLNCQTLEAAVGKLPSGILQQQYSDKQLGTEKGDTADKTRGA